MAEPARSIPLDPARLLRLRVWAAAVRDRQGDHAQAVVEVAALAKTLCGLLDMRGGLQADNARGVVDGNIALLVGVMVLSGARWP